MKKVILCAALVLIGTAAFSQGFKKTGKVEKIGNYKMGNFFMYRHSTDSLVLYSFTLRDREYNDKISSK